MPTEFWGVLVVPLIVGLVQVCKRLGLGDNWAAPVSVLAGVVLSVCYQVATAYPTAAPWLQAVLVGMALGLSASGLYSGARQVMKDGDDGESYR